MRIRIKKILNLYSKLKSRHVCVAVLQIGIISYVYIITPDELLHKEFYYYCLLIMLFSVSILIRCDCAVVCGAFCLLLFLAGNRVS